MKKGKVLVLFLLMLETSIPALAYKNIPALVNVNRYEQVDTLGYNLVSSLCSLFYTHIIDGSIPLYTAADKSLRLDADGLKSLELATGQRFDSCQDLFLNEYWSSTRKKTAFQISGFSFVGKNSQGKKVSFGYIEYAAVKELLANKLIPTTANGSANISFKDVLISRRYPFHLVQLGEETFYANPELAIKLKRDAFASGKILVNATPLPQTKELAYSLKKKKYHTDIDFGNLMLRSIEKNLHENPELFLNLIGFKGDSTPQLNPTIPELVGIECIETWSKNGNRIGLSNAQIRLVFSDKRKSEWITLSELECYEVLIQFKGLREFLFEKPFQYELTRINNQEINPNLGPNYIEALKKSPWSQVNAYALR